MLSVNHRTYNIITSSIISCYFTNSVLWLDDWFVLSCLQSYLLNDIFKIDIDNISVFYHRNSKTISSKRICNKTKFNIKQKNCVIWQEKISLTSSEQVWIEVVYGVLCMSGFDASLWCVADIMTLLHVSKHLEHFCYSRRIPSKLCDLQQNYSYYKQNEETTISSNSVGHSISFTKLIMWKRDMVFRFFLIIIGHYAFNAVRFTQKQLHITYHGNSKKPTDIAPSEESNKKLTT